MSKVCACCKEEREYELFSKDKKRSDGLYVYCKPCVKEKSAQRYLENKDSINEKARAWKEKNRDSYLAQQRAYNKIYAQTPDGKYREYKGGATKRNYEWALSKEAFMTYWQKPCDYCGDPIETVGIDRIDNSAGYTADNTIPCCYICNRAKDTMTREDYMAHCRKVANR
jgi:hypothetical protein